MKIKKLLLYISFVLIMFLSTTNVYASGGVTIKSIDLVDKSIMIYKLRNKYVNKMLSVRRGNL